MRPVLSLTRACNDSAYVASSGVAEFVVHHGVMYTRCRLHGRTVFNPGIAKPGSIIKIRLPSDETRLQPTTVCDDSVSVASSGVAKSAVDHGVVYIRADFMGHPVFTPCIPRWGLSKRVMYSLGQDSLIPDHGVQ